MPASFNLVVQALAAATLSLLLLFVLVIVILIVSTFAILTARPRHGERAVLAP